MNIEKELFSPTERKLLKILGKRKMSLLEISEKLYDDAPKQPINANILASNLVTRINKKTDHHDLPWFINGQGQGRGGKTVWLDERK